MELTTIHTLLISLVLIGALFSLYAVNKLYIIKIDLYNISINGKIK